MAFTLASEDLKDGGTLPTAQVYNGMGLNGANLSPQLSWSDPPPGTQSFALTLYDPDAPTGSGWWHWLVANIPANCRSLVRGAGSGKASLPPGALMARNDYGSSDFGGAAPPPGPAHRYIFTIYALRVAHIDVDRDCSGAKVGFMVNMNRLASASLTAHYGR
jgi:Raf kinase inhibitor-like YbhB/YbcL family protein